MDFFVLAPFDTGRTWTSQAIHILNEHFEEDVLGQHLVRS